MHESSLSRTILQRVLEGARAAGASKVRRVRGTIAETEQLAAPSLEFHFQAHARGTIAERAVLELELVHIEARCKRCGTEYLPEHHLTLCPRCSSTEAELLGTPGVHISDMDVEP